MRLKEVGWSFRKSSNPGSAHIASCQAPKILDHHGKLIKLSDPVNGPNTDKHRQNYLCLLNRHRHIKTFEF